VQSYP